MDTIVPMEPVQTSPSPDAQGATALPDTRPASGGRLSRVTGLATRALGLDQQPAQAAQQAPASSFEPAATPGLQPRIDTTPATGAVVPSPWASPDGAIPGGATDSTVTNWTTEPAAPTTPEPIAEPDATTSPEPIATTPAPEPVTAPEPEPSPAIAPVWTPDASPTQPITAIEPDMRPSSTPSVEPIISSALPEDAGSAVTTPETAEEPPLFRKVADGDLIRYEFTPEGREKIKGAFTKAIDSGAFDDLAGIFASGQGVEPKTDTLSTPTPTLEPQPEATPQAELPPPIAETPNTPTSPFNLPTPGGTV